MAALAQSKVRAYVDTYGLAHTGNFDVRIAGLTGAYRDFMPALGVTFDREQVGDVETIPGLPATVVREEDGRNVTMTLYDNNQRHLESQMREWMAQATPSLRKAVRMSSYTREVSLIERVIQVTGQNGIENNSIFSDESIRQAAAGAAARAIRPVSERVRFELAQVAADLQRKFHTGWFNKNLDDIQQLRQLPSLRKQIFESAIDSQKFQVLERRNTYLAIPQGVIQTNADLTGKGGLANIEINLRIVGEIDGIAGFQRENVNPNEFAP